jgi:hypothetical protein
LCVNVALVFVVVIVWTPESSEVRTAAMRSEFCHARRKLLGHATCES